MGYCVLDGGKVMTLEERLWARSPRTFMQRLLAGYCVLRTLGLGPWAHWGLGPGPIEA